MKQLSRIKLATVASLLAGMPALVTAAARPVSFAHDIRPLLSNACFKCHGPDEMERKGGPKGSGGLRLDTEEGARANLGGRAAIVAGHADDSELMKRIIETDEDEVMPPPKSGNPLTPAEVKMIADWIDGGATYSKHWSYEPLAAVEAPLKETHPIDAFIRDRLKRENLQAQPEADRPTLARRLSFDLTGLPPSPESVDAFVNDQAPDAYNRMVDRLLASPAYGEHWSRQWLDLARYADSAGYADDPSRQIWAYRDYVIRSFNTNKSFDQFTIEQIAGDLLTDPTEDQLIATAFHRNTMTNNEGGTNDEEFRNAAVIDRVNTTLAVWMGTSMACAQCHTHKYDPITQTEYFSMFAFLNNTADADLRDEAPLLSFYTGDQKARRQKLEAGIAELEARFSKPTPAMQADADQWAKQFPLPIEWQALMPDALKSQAGLAMTRENDGTVTVANSSAKDTYLIEIPSPAMRTLTALRLEALPHDSLPNKGPGHAAGNFVITGINVKVKPPENDTSKPENAPEIQFTGTAADYVQPDFDETVVLKTGKAAKPRDPKSGWAIGGATGIAHSLTLTTSKPVEIPAGSTLVITIEQQSSHANHTLGRFRLSATGDPTAARLSEIPTKIAKILALPAAQRDAAQQTILTDHYLRNLAPELAADRKSLANLQKQYADLQPTTVPIFRELPEGKRRKSHLQVRGNYLNHGDEVTEGVPMAIFPLPEGGTRNRLTLARWLVDPANPLTARVIANRFWESLFGIGIVRTSEEFGAQGDPPSHPELLDWLALDFIRSGWDMKHLIRLIVTSETYRQSSKIEAGMAERDPENRLLARGPRVRLSAEMVRDQALATSGLLSPAMFGPSVRPIRPALGLSAAFGGGLDWQTSAGGDQYRRALYTEWRRTSPYPSMATFDAPSREICTLRRDRSNTPLQALVLLNDPVYVEAAQALARRVTAKTSAPEEAIREAFRLVLSRLPSDTELRRLLALREELFADYQKDPKKAAEMATIPIGPLPAGTDPRRTRGMDRRDRSPAQSR